MAASSKNERLAHGAGKAEDRPGIHPANVVELGLEIFETVPTPLLVLDSELNVRLANDAFYQQFRVNPSETVGQSIRSLGDGQWNVPGLLRLLSDVLPRNASVVDYEVHYNFAEIGPRIMLLNGRQVFPRTGEDAYILLAIRDITEQRTYEKRLRELNQKLQHQNSEVSLAYQELEAFSYSVSHDLRAPLRAIEGFSQGVLDECADKLDETGRDYLRRIRSAALRMSRLIDDLLQLSQISRATPRLEEVDLAAEATSILDELRRASPGRQVDVRVDVSTKVMADRHLAVVALTNLLGNAWKFTTNKQHALIEFGSQEHEGQQVFFVRDNGIGFDPNHAKGIFEPFHRLHPTDDFPGSGIGLAIVRRVIRRHQGRIWTEGAAGKGATFYFTLTPDFVNLNAEDAL